MGVDCTFQATSPVNVPFRRHVATSGSHGACLRVCVRDSPSMFDDDFETTTVKLSVTKEF